MFVEGTGVCMSVSANVQKSQVEIFAKLKGRTFRYVFRLLSMR